MQKLQTITNNEQALTIKRLDGLNTASNMI